MPNANERLVELDALRGFALLGVLVVNIFIFHGPYSHYSEVYGSYNGIDAAVVELTSVFFAGKFLFIFALLFGCGVALQEASHGTGFSAVHARRMVALLLFGATHLIFLWFGDILASYALLGFGLLALRRLGTRWVLIIGGILLLVRPLYYVGATRLGWPMVEMGKPESLETFTEVMRGGNYLEILKLRLREFVAFLPENAVWFIPKTMGLFALGYGAMRARFTEVIRARPGAAVALGAGAVALGLGWMFVRGQVFGLVDLEAIPLVRPVFILGNVLAEFALGCGYVTCLVALFQRSARIARVFAPVGRTALTNYLFQSLACVLIFHGWGLGLYLRLTPVQLVLLAFALYLAQLLGSHAWLRAMNRGPLEALWRRLASLGAPTRR
jgi:uncharacterized protein